MFTRHSGIFHVSLREAYKGDEPIDRDPLPEIKDKFLELLAEGHKQRPEHLRLKRELSQEDMKFVAARSLIVDDH